MLVHNLILPRVYAAAPPLDLTSPCRECMLYSKDERSSSGGGGGAERLIDALPIRLFSEAQILAARDGAFPLPPPFIRNKFALISTGQFSSWVMCFDTTRCDAIRCDVR